MAYPLVIAHRGLTPGAGENQLAGIRQAQARGADLIELDIRLSLDRKPVVLHDAMLGRTTNGIGWVGVWPSVALRRLRLRTDPNHAERLMLLDDLLVTDDQDPLPDLAFHLKDRRALHPVLRLILKRGFVARSWLWLEHVDDAIAAQRLAPGIRATLLHPDAWREPERTSYIAAAALSECSAISLHPGAIDSNVVRTAHLHQLAVFTRIDDDFHIDRLMGLGVDGFITDDPTGTRKAIAAPPES